MEILARPTMKIQEITNLIKNSRYDEAFDECFILLRETPERKDEILRIRAHAYARSGDYPNAVRDYEEVIDGGTGASADYYLAAYNALYFEEYEKSEIWFRKVLADGEREKETWFRSATLFYLAFIKMELGDLAEAIRFLEKLEGPGSDNGLPLPEVGMCNRSQLRAEIERRKLNK